MSVSCLSFRRITCSPNEQYLAATAKDVSHELAEQVQVDEVAHIPVLHRRPVCRSAPCGESVVFYDLMSHSASDTKCQERDGIPIFAADLCLLQPMKSTTSDRKESKTENRIPTPGPSVVPDPQSAPVTAVATDGTCTPTSSAHVLHLEALMQRQQQQQESQSPDPPVSGSSSASKSQLLVSQLEQELLSDLQVPNNESKERRTTDGERLLQRLLTTGSNNSSCLSSHPPSLSLNNGFPSPGLKVNGTSVAHVESKVRVGMSAEASQILDELPLLSFLRSNLTS